MVADKLQGAEGVPEVPARRLALPELLAPAGNWECARAAVENGADAIYFGLEHFNARMRADNFTLAELPQLMEFLHRRGVRGYVCYNTLIFADELMAAEQELKGIIAAGPDAILVQDAGICRLIRQLSPDVPIHASTQMTITSAAGVDFARELGCHLAVLARECSIKEIEKIQAANGGAGVPPLPLETFVHGALCVAYSGQCLTSEALGGRSANRGVCAQACRMTYDLISDDQLVPLGDRRYLLSPQDLAGLPLLPELIRSGLASLKIEGRLKTPEYVANITHMYREALDKVWAELSDPAHAQQRPAVPMQAYQYKMEMAFSRGIYTGWLQGINNQKLVHGRFGTKRGVYLGEVKRIQGDRVSLELQGPLKPGDGIVFDAGKPEEKEEGGRVYEIFPVRNARPGQPTSREVALTFGRGDINFSRLRVGDKVWKTSDPELERHLRQTFAGTQPRFQRPIWIEVHGHVGAPMTVIAGDDTGCVAKLASNLPLAQAEKQPLSTEKLAEQLGRLGGTPFKLGQIKNRLEGQVILPVSELNRLRRELAADLEKQRALPRRWQLTAGPSPIATFAPSAPAAPPPPASTAQLIVLVRDLAQLDAALQCGVQRLYCDFDDPKLYRDAVRRVREACSCQGPQREIWAAPPRIFKPGEEWILKQVRSCDADGYLVRNYDHLKFFADTRCIGDYSLNVANPLTADYLKSHYPLERLTASYDLNLGQLEALLRGAPPEWFEITIHQHMPMFHMEHCVFCTFLSQGTDYTNCGRPCDKHKVRLKDRVGAEHPVHADAGCRNTVFNGVAQTGAEAVAQLLALGVRLFRLEFVSETPNQVERTIAKYRQLLRGEISGAELWRELKLFNQLGVTRGQILGSK